MTAAEYLALACPHFTEHPPARSECRLCFFEAVHELLALRDRSAQWDAKAPGLARTNEGLRAERDELRETLAAQPQWIPVTDRLPESGIPVLIVIDGTVYRGAHCAEGTVECDEDDDGAVLREDTDTCERAPGWYWCDSLGLAWVRSLIPGMFNGPPTHWMPMPPAPASDRAAQWDGTAPALERTIDDLREQLAVVGGERDSLRLRVQQLEADEDRLDWLGETATMAQVVMLACALNERDDAARGDRRAADGWQVTRAASTLADLPLFAQRARTTDPASSHAASARVQRAGIASAQRREALQLVARWPGHTASELAALACDDDAERERLFRRLGRRLCELRDAQPARVHNGYTRFDVRGLRWWLIEDQISDARLDG